MKQIKLLMVALTMLMGVALTSCMTGESESTFDAVGYMTVVENIYTGNISLLADDGYKYAPTNPGALKNTKGEYAERVLVYLKFSEGVVVTADKTKPYSVSVVSGQGLYTKKFCNAPDTIQNSYPLSELGEAWAANGYYNIIFSYYAAPVVSVDMVPEKAEEDLLTVKLVQTVGKKGGYETATGLISFKIPRISELNAELAKKEPSTELKAKDGEVRIKVIADGNNETVLTKDAIKIKLLD